HATTGVRACRAWSPRPIRPRRDDGPTSGRAEAGADPGVPVPATRACVLARLRAARCHPRDVGTARASLPRIAPYGEGGPPSTPGRWPPRTSAKRLWRSIGGEL